MNLFAPDAQPRTIERYRLHDPIASGGMATVHFGRLVGAVGFSRVVAIKRLHESYARDPDFVRMFLDEARVAARVRHPNVVSTLDVVASEDEVFLVMEYVHGESLSKLLRLAETRPIPAPVVVAIACGVLEGLQGAHDATNEHGEPLRIVHRDVSPQNVLLGADGVARVFDFGIAKAADASEHTREGVIKGKISYMAPEQVHGGAVDPRADVYSAGVVLWELLVGRKRHAGAPNAQVFLKLARGELAPPEPPSSLRADVPAALDAIVACAVDADRERRFPSARAMALALEEAVTPATPRAVATWLREVSGASLDRAAAIVRRLERDEDGVDPRPSSASRITAASSVPGGIEIGSVRTRPPPSDRDLRAQAETLPAPPPRAGARRAAVVLVGVVAVVLVALAARSRGSEAPPNVEAAAAPAAPSALESPSSAPAASVSASAAGAGSPSSAEPSVAPSHPVKHEPKPPRPVRPAVSATTAAPPKAAKSGCESPFTIGPDGIRQVKPECM